MEILSVKEAYFLFKKAWWELARTGCDKEDVRSVDLLQFSNLCPLCEWTSSYNKTCDECPVEWPSKGDRIGSCHDGFLDILDIGIYTEWQLSIDAGELKRSKEIAKNISELPLKEKYQKYLK